MKKIIALILALTCIGIVYSASGIRVAQGEVASHTYINDGDYVNTCLYTTDGEAWIAEGYLAPIGDKVFIIYDKCSSSTIYDDEILGLIHFTKF